MGCRCNERRQQLGEAAKLIAAGEAHEAASKMAAAGRTLGKDAAAFGRSMVKRLAASHARLKR